jgi:hypothetical protein
VVAEASRQIVAYHGIEKCQLNEISNQYRRKYIIDGVCNVAWWRHGCASKKRNIMKWRRAAKRKYEMKAAAWRGWRIASAKESR